MSKLAYRREHDNDLFRLRERVEGSTLHTRAWLNSPTARRSTPPA